MRLDVVVKDIVGVTGTKIITAFIAGETKGKELGINTDTTIAENQKKK